MSQNALLSLSKIIVPDPLHTLTILFDLRDDER